MSRRGSVRGVEELSRLIFNYFDKDKDGFWNAAELSAAINATEQRQLPHNEYLDMCAASGSNPEEGLSSHFVTKQYEEDSQSLVRDARIVKELELENRSRRGSVPSTVEFEQPIKKVGTCPVVSSRRFSIDNSEYSVPPPSSSRQTAASVISDFDVTSDGDPFYEPTLTPITSITQTPTLASYKVTPSAKSINPTESLSLLTATMATTAATATATVIKDDDDDDLKNFHSCISDTSSFSGLSANASIPIQLPASVEVFKIRLGDLTNIANLTGQVVVDSGVVSELLLQSGDVLVEVNGSSLLSPFEYVRQIATASRSDSCSLSLLKKGTNEPFTLVLPTGIQNRGMGLAQEIPFTGVSLSARLHQHSGHVGQLVTQSTMSDFDPNSLKQGDLVTHVNGSSVFNLAHYNSTLKTATPGIVLNITLMRSETNMLDTIRLVVNGQPISSIAALCMVVEPKVIRSACGGATGQLIVACPLLGVDSTKSNKLILSHIGCVPVEMSHQMKEFIFEIRPGDKIELQTFNCETIVSEKHTVTVGIEAVVPYFTALDEKKQKGLITERQFENAKRAVLSMSLSPAVKVEIEKPVKIEKHGDYDTPAPVYEMEQPDSRVNPQKIVHENKVFETPTLDTLRPIKSAEGYPRSDSVSYNIPKDLISPVRPFDIEPLCSYDYGGIPDNSLYDMNYSQIRPSVVTVSPVDCLTPMSYQNVGSCVPPPVPTFSLSRQPQRYRDTHNININHSSLMRRRTPLSVTPAPYATPASDDIEKNFRKQRCLLSPKGKPKPLTAQPVNTVDQQRNQSNMIPLTSTTNDVMVTSSVWDASVQKVADAAQSWKKVAQNIETVLSHTTAVTQELEERNKLSNQTEDLAPAEDVLGPVLTDIIWNKAKYAREVIAVNVEVKPPIQLRCRLINFFEKYRPDKLPSVVNTLISHRGKEESVFTALTAKYGPEPAADILSVPLAFNWTQQESPQGDVFYVNVVTGEKRWQRPLKDRTMESGRYS